MGKKYVTRVVPVCRAALPVLMTVSIVMGLRTVMKLMTCVPTPATPVHHKILFVMKQIIYVWSAFIQVTVTMVLLVP